MVLSPSPSIFPALFLIACVLAFASGTSWGTFGILIPLGLAITESHPELSTPIIAACMAGAVYGDHCSPISDTTIMASAGAQCDHLVHVATQLPYALTVAGISFVMFIIASIVARGMRFFLIGWLIWKFGAPIKVFQRFRFAMSDA